jgi:hypothetical protein
MMENSKEKLFLPISFLGFLTCGYIGLFVWSEVSKVDDPNMIWFKLYSVLCFYSSGIFVHYGVKYFRRQFLKA